MHIHDRETTLDFRSSLFGPETPPIHPDEVLAELQRQSLSSLQVASASLQALPLGGSKEVRRELRGIQMDLDVAEKRLRDERVELRVALLGRTMSGKSTLFEYLTYGDGTRIGEGAQRTTRSSLERDVPLVPGVVLIDTPGVGARDGDEDRLVAFETALSCDIILWVATNDSTQQETARALQEVAGWGKPIYVFLNCGARVDTPARRKRIASHPDFLLRDIDGHWARLDSFLGPRGVVPAQRFAGHALAAYAGHMDGDDALIQASGVKPLVEALLRDSRDLRHGHVAVRLIDAVRAPLNEGTDSLLQLAQVAAREAETTRQQASEGEARMRRALAEVEQSGMNELNRIVDSQRTWYANVDLDGDVQGGWDREMGTLHRLVTDLLARLDQELQTTFQEEWGAFVEDWTYASSTDDSTVRNQSTSGKGNRLTKALVRVAPGGAAIAAPFLLTNPGGWTVLGIGLAAMGTNLLLEKTVLKKGGWLDRVIPGRQAKREAFRRDLRTQTGEDLGRLLDHAKGSWLRRVGEYGNRTEAWSAEQSKQANESADLATALAAAGAALDSQMEPLDFDLARGLLRIEGRNRSAEALTRSVRIPGVGVALGVPASIRDELALFPLHRSPEKLFIFESGAATPIGRQAADVVFAGSCPPFWMGSTTGDTLTFRVGTVAEGANAVGLTRLAEAVSQMPVEIREGAAA